MASSNVTLRIASKLSGDDVAKVASFAKKHGVSTLPTAKIDSNLLGGFVLEIDGTEYDYSLSGDLSRLGKSL